jgi:hypothetical protein
MGVWDFRLFEQEIDKWKKLSLDESLPEDHRVLYLKKVEQVTQSRERYAREWEINAAWRKENPHGYRSE